MSGSLQDSYAKHLPCAKYGYPLWMPEPMGTLPEDYLERGLQIGDVGTVDREGWFDVLFNICKGSNNALHVCRGVPKNFQPVQPVKDADVRCSDNAISAGAIHSSGITRHLQPDNLSRLFDYEFDLSTRAGAILILPSGAESQQLSPPEQFLEVARVNALDWYKFAKACYKGHLDRSLYLITGFYKARSWSLGSFEKSTGDIGKILARRHPDNPNVYKLESSCRADLRHSSVADVSGSVNQAVFITGFKITVRSWLPDPVVSPILESETLSILACMFKVCLSWLLGFFDGYKHLPQISMEHCPQLSQPFHPSDIINRFLLNKKPDAEVAITHDSQWMDMMKEGLTHEDLLQEDCLGTFLTRFYTISVDSERENTTVFLKSKVADPHDTSPEPEISDPPAFEFEVSSSPTSELEISLPATPEQVPSPPISDLEFSPPPSPPFDAPWIVITCIRAQNIFSDLKRMPVGFYVLVQFGGDQRRTQNKSIRVSDSGIEWKDEIVLPSKAFDVVRLTVYASFELEPMLGNGEALYTSESRVEELVNGTNFIHFPPGKSRTAAPPSLLITVGRSHSNHPAVVPSGDGSNLDSEESSVLIRETDLGQEALLLYHNSYQREDLENAAQHFECALYNCSPTHQCRAAMLVNLAKAKFLSYQTDPTGATLDEPISLYRQALELRHSGHPDRPATLLQLAQTLIFRYEKQGCDESVADEINKLMTNSQHFPEGSHERRAADLVLETLKRCRVVNSGRLVELNYLVPELERSSKVAPDGYFDRPQRLINLSTTLWRRYEIDREPSDLHYSLQINKKALQLLPTRSPDRLPAVRTLAPALWRLFEIRGELDYLTELIELSEGALQLMPEGHPERTYWVTNSKSYRAEMLDCLGDIALEDQKYAEGVEQYFQSITVLQSISSYLSPLEDMPA